MVYLELHCTGMAWERGPQIDSTHSSRKAIADNPTWRLVLALSTLTNPDGNGIMDVVQKKPETLCSFGVASSVKG